MEAVVPEEAAREDEAGGREGEGVVELVLEQRVLRVKDAVVERGPAVEVEQRVPQEVSVLRVLLGRKQGLVQLLASPIEGGLVEGCAGSIGDDYLIVLCELSVEDKDDV